MNINNNIQALPTLDINDKVIDAENCFSHYQCKTIVILEVNQYKGLLFKEHLKQLNEAKNLIEYKPILKQIYLTKGFSIFDWFKISFVHKLNIIPLVDIHDFSYLKSISYDDFAEQFKNSGLGVDNSSILILKKPTIEFKYSEVFQIAESYGAKIFGSYINFSNQNETEIVINLLHLGLNELLQSYRRYGFEVISFHDEDLYQETLKSNSEYLSKYLTV